jgi:hypothetical protein
VSKASSADRVEAIGKGEQAKANEEGSNKRECTEPLVHICDKAPRVLQFGIPPGGELSEGCQKLVETLESIKHYFVGAVEKDGCILPYLDTREPGRNRLRLTLMAFTISRNWTTSNLFTRISGLEDLDGWSTYEAVETLSSQ